MFKYILISVGCVLSLVGCGGGGSSCDVLKVSGGESCENKNASAVIVQFLGRNGSTGQCSGSFISLTSILTAAHCTIPLIRDGGGSVEVITSTAAASSAAQVLINPNFFASGGLSAYDVAIVKVDPTLAKVTNAQPQPLSFNSEVKVGSTVTVVGFGLTESGQLPDDLNPKAADMEVVRANQGVIVAKSKSGSTCFGDSGGPLYADINGRKSIVGIVSAGVGRPECGSTKLTIFADIATSEDGIRANAPDAIVVD